MKRVSPCLWFDGQAEAAADFYASTLDDARVMRTDTYTEAGKEIHGHQPGSVMSVEFEIEGLPFVALNGGPEFHLSPAISFLIGRRTIDEVNALWEKLLDGGTVNMPLDSYPFSQRYGWLSDKFGVSWQVILTPEKTTPGVTPSLMFTGAQAGHAEEAMHFYTSVFPDSSVGDIMRYRADQAPDMAGTVAYGEMTILGQKIATMDSAREHDFTFSEAISLMVLCDTQAEIDEYWQALSYVPEAEACGWLKDKYGVSWQIVPTLMNEMQRQGTPQQLERVTAAFMQMKKFDIAELERAYSQT
jgi:predicted 3-demethylubiquinone-9 3-methyltransferase (glyoxalase superfamily)